MKRVGWLFFSILLLIVLDQMTKYFVRTHFYLGESISVLPSFFSFTYVQNPGVAFGFLADGHESWRRPLLLAIPLIACVWLAVLIWQARKSPQWLLSVAYALIFAGAFGNLIDRFYLGYVVDFFDFYVGMNHFPAFNIADSCISVAAALLILDFILEFRRTNKKRKANAAVTRRDFRRHTFYLSSHDGPSLGLCLSNGGMVLEKKMNVLSWNIFFWGTFALAWLGAKALFLLTTSEEGLITSSSFWLGGGFVFYGGLLAALSFIFCFSILHPTFKWRDLSFLVPILLFSHGLGRIGCFLAGCCYGKEMEHFHLKHPVQLYESISLMGLAFLFGKILKKEKKEELVLALYFLSYAVLRFSLEFFRGDSLRGLYGVFSTSQWISLGLLIPAAILLVMSYRRKKYGI